MSGSKQQQRQDPPQLAGGTGSTMVVSLEAVKEADVVFEHGTSQLLRGRFGARTTGNRPDRFRDLFAYFRFIRRLSPEAREAEGWELAADDEEDVVEGGDGTPEMLDRDTAVKLARFVHTRIQHEDHGLFLEPVSPGSLASFRVIPHYQVVPRLADMFRRRLKPTQQPEVGRNERAPGPGDLPPAPITIPRREVTAMVPIIIPRWDNSQPGASIIIPPRYNAAADPPTWPTAAMPNQGQGPPPPSQLPAPADPPPSSSTGVPTMRVGVAATEPVPATMPTKEDLPPPSVMTFISVPAPGTKIGQKTTTDISTHMPSQRGRPEPPSSLPATSSTGAALKTGVVTTELSTSRIAITIPRREPPPRNSPVSNSLPPRDAVAGATKAVAPAAAAAAAAAAALPEPSQRQRPKPPPATSLPQQHQQQLGRTKGGGGDVTTKLKASDVARAISAEASSVAYVYDRGVNVDAHVPEGSWVGDGNGTANTNMYSLLRSWVQDDPHRKVVGGDLLDYETIQVPVFDPKSHLTSTAAAAAIPPIPSSPNVWSCLAECRKWTAQVPDQPTTAANLPDLAALLRERTQQYREQRKAHKRALHAKDQHVLEAMKKRGIHIEPSPKRKS